MPKYSSCIVKEAKINILFDSPTQTQTQLWLILNKNKIILNLVLAVKSCTVFADSVNNGETNNILF